MKSLLARLSLATVCVLGMSLSAWSQDGSGISATLFYCDGSSTQLTDVTWSYEYGERDTPPVQSKGLEFISYKPVFSHSTRLELKPMGGNSSGKFAPVELKDIARITRNFNFRGIGDSIPYGITLELVDGKQVTFFDMHADCRFLSRKPHVFAEKVWLSGRRHEAKKFLPPSEVMPISGLTLIRLFTDNKADQGSALARKFRDTAGSIVWKIEFGASEPVDKTGAPLAKLDAAEAEMKKLLSFAVLESKMVDSDRVYVAQLNSPEGNKLSGPVLSSLASSIGRKGESFQVWWYLQGEKVARKAWAISAVSEGKTETKILRPLEKKPRAKN